MLADYREIRAVPSVCNGRRLSQPLALRLASDTAQLDLGWSTGGIDVRAQPSRKRALWVIELQARYGSQGCVLQQTRIPRR
jgi:hypothetical protein